jgi:hypothetical protein
LASLNLGISEGTNLTQPIELNSAFFLILAGWIVALYIMLTYVSEKISLVGIYHKLKSPANPNGESFFHKIAAISKCNFNLTYPSAAAYFVVIRTTIPDITVNDASVLSLLVTLATLLVLRILANPCECTKPNICSFYENSIEDALLDSNKERVLSFFYAFICTSMILGLIVLSYGLLKGDTGIFIGTFDLLNFMIITISYLVALFIFTLLGELILKYCVPIRKI